MIIRNKDLVIDGISPKLLKGCIAEHQKTIERFQKLDDYYVGRHDILNRKKASKYVPNNKIVANFPKYITDTAAGYMFGNAVTYQSDDPKGLYSLILSSKLPNAKKFKRWVVSEVLPAIRKTGGYPYVAAYGKEYIVVNQIKRGDILFCNASKN